MSQWTIDPDHSVGSFAIRHMTIAFVHGQFNKISGTIDLDPSDITSFNIEFDVDVNSIITGIQKRDDHLKSADFFDADKFQKMHFKSTAAERTAFNSCKVIGELAIHGIKKTLNLEADILGPVKSPFGETSIGISGSIVLDREDFGLTWNEPMENNGFMVGKEVAVTVNIEADLVE